MRQFKVSVPQLAFVAATRGALGLGAGLLLSPKIPASRRERIGWGLVTVGLLTTIPIALNLVWQRGRSAAEAA